MAVTTMNLGFAPKGRPTIRRSTPSGKSPRYVEMWAIPEAKPGTTLSKLEAAYLSALACVDEIEERKAVAKKSGTFTDEGVITDALAFAASQLAPRLKRARLAVEGAKAELATRREKLTVKPADKTDAAGQARRLWKLDRFNALSDAERNAVTADATTIRRSKNSPRFLLLRLQLFNECSEVRRHRCREGIVLVPQSFFGRTARTEISDCQRKMSF